MKHKGFLSFTILVCILMAAVTGLLVWAGVSIVHGIETRGLKNIIEQVWEGEDAESR